MCQELVTFVETVIRSVFVKGKDKKMELVSDC